MRLSAEMGGDSIPVITPIDTTYTITDQTKIKEHRKLAYLEIPILFSYHIPCSPQCHIGLSVGPYFGFGLFGKYTIEDTRFPDIEQGRGDVFSKNMYSTRLDVGIMAGAHIELYKHYRLGVNYAQGLTSLQESIGPQEIKPKNRTWSVSVGYIF